MRFPLRLTAELGIALAARAFVREGSHPLVAPLDSAELTNDPDESLKSDAAALWIGGSEPLIQPEIAEVTRELLGTGRYVFLRTDGELWRRRVHEFRPVSRFFLTVDCNEGGDRRTKEAIRIARLSGFFTCVHTEISSTTDAGKMQALCDYVETLRSDGWVITTSSTAGTVEHSAVKRTAAEARKLIPSHSWRIFSELVEAEVRARKELVQQVEETLVDTSTSEPCEERAGAQ